MSKTPFYGSVYVLSSKLMKSFGQTKHNGSRWTPQSKKLTASSSSLVWMELFRAEFLAQLAQLRVGILTSRIGKIAKTLIASLLFFLHSNQRRWPFRNKISTLKKLSIPQHAKNLYFVIKRV